MKYGLIGEHLTHSHSPFVHRALGNPDFVLKEIAPEELDDFLQEADFCGLTVTIPYKQRVMAHCVVDERARDIGCVNTIVNRGGTLYGYNTDVLGFAFTVRRMGLSFQGKKVLILGGGGTSKTVGAYARDEGARAVIKVSRSGENHYGNLERHADAEILVNTTPVGMFPHNGQSPVELSRLPHLCAVIDVVYNPIKTALRLEAERAGLPCAGGLPMLVAQAAYAHRLFFDMDTDEAATTETIERVLRELEAKLTNLVLVGMPGCGKTTIGTMLAARLDRPFVDTDRVIFEHCGKTPAEIIERDGEAAFRDVEQAVIAQVTKTGGQVIATGGGSVLRPENRDALRQNGRVIFLSRELAELATDDRPLSADPDALWRLYTERLPIYESICDIQCNVSGSISDQMDHILTKCQLGGFL